MITTFTFAYIWKEATFCWYIIWNDISFFQTTLLVNCNIASCPKKFGGLGVREARLTNISLLRKLIWSLINEKDKFWVQVITRIFGQSFHLAKQHCQGVHSLDGVCKEQWMP